MIPIPAILLAVAKTAVAGAVAKAAAPQAARLLTKKNGGKMGARSLINPSENENPEEREARLALGTGQMHAAEPRGRLRNRQRRVKE